MSGAICVVQGCQVLFVWCRDVWCYLCGAGMSGAGEPSRRWANGRSNMRWKYSVGIEVKDRVYYVHGTVHLSI